METSPRPSPAQSSPARELVLVLQGDILTRAEGQDGAGTCDRQGTVPWLAAATSLLDTLSQGPLVLSAQIRAEPCLWELLSRRQALKQPARCAQGWDQQTLPAVRLIYSPLTGQSCPSASFSRDG